MYYSMKVVSAAIDKGDETCGKILACGKDGKNRKKAATHEIFSVRIFVVYTRCTFLGKSGVCKRRQ